jgi:hypothetical protein
MTSGRTVEYPPTLGLLEDPDVLEFLSPGVRSGQELPPQVALRKAASILSETESRWRSDPIRELLDEAMRRFAMDKYQADGWLAPRLHATLRMTRAEASDRRRWNYLAMLVAPDYVAWRHGGNGVLAAVSRFSGVHHTQAFSRLWWAAELFRDGGDYHYVEVACQKQDVLNTTMRHEVIDHRPTALAIARVVEEMMTAGVSRLSDRINALSTAVNAAGSTLLYDVIAPDRIADIGEIYEWIDETATMAPVPWDRLPHGPDDGGVRPEAVETLVPLFRDLLAGASLRQRPGDELSEDS